MSAAPISIALVADAEPAKLLEPVDSDRQLGARVPDVQLDAPVGRSGHEDGIRLVGEQLQRLVEVGRAHERALRAGDLGGLGGGRRLLQPGLHRVVGIGLPECVGRIHDRAVAGAAAEVAAERVQVEAVRVRARASWSPGVTVARRGRRRPLFG